MPPSHYRSLVDEMVTSVPLGQVSLLYPLIFSRIFQRTAVTRVQISAGALELIGRNIYKVGLYYIS